ncbi:MAG: hypothetical protein K1X75_11520 [Leptospirales bacterium]|nr:hypothetical protein [Leptospirales bacterium]
MPIDQSTADSILGTFRGMARDVAARKLSGPAVDDMNAVLAEMERLAKEMDDIISYTTKLTTEDLFVKFSNAYSKALAAAAQSQGQATDDDSLLKQSLGAYENSYNTLKSDPKNQHLLPPLQKLLALGKSGVSYPVFLRKAEEQGLFAEMNAGSPGPNIEFELHCAEVMGYPLEVEMKRKIKQGFEELCARHPFHIADPLEFRLMRQKVEWEYAPRLARWKGILDRWERMISMVTDWLDAHCEFAPRDERWLDPIDPSRTPINIARTKECQPGRLAVRESVFHEYFGLRWDDIWTHETYQAELKAARIWDSDERTRLIQEAYRCCKPGGAPEKSTIQQNEALHRSGGLRHPRNLERFGTEQKPGPGYKFRDFAEFVK